MKLITLCSLGNDHLTLRERGVWFFLKQIYDPQFDDFQVDDQKKYILNPDFIHKGIYFIILKK